MQIQIEIGFDQLVNAAKKLPAKQWKKLKSAVEVKPATMASNELEKFLLSAPTFNKKQLDEIQKSRKQFGKWRDS